MKRTELVSWLTTNCDCWKGKDAVLNDEKAFTEEDLKKLKNNTEGLTLAVNTLKEISVTLKAPTDAKVTDLPRLAANAMSASEKAAAKKKEDAKDGGKDDDEEDDTGAKMNKEQFATNMREFFKGMPAEERINFVDPTLNEVLKAAKDVMENQRTQVINALTSDIKDETARNAMVKKLKEEKTGTLNTMAELRGIKVGTSTPANNEGPSLTSFFATGGNAGPTNNDAPSATGGNLDKVTLNRKDVLLPSSAYAEGFEDDVS